MELANTKIFKIEVTWHIISNLMSFDIDFHLIYFLSKVLLHHIYNATDLRKKMLYIA